MRTSHRQAALPQQKTRAAQAIEQCQQFSPFGRLEPKKTYTVTLQDVHPVIRIAHRIRGRLQIPVRIIRDHELVLILRGRGTVAFHPPAPRGGQRIEQIDFDGLRLIFIEPFVPHEFQSDDPDFEHIAVHFDFSQRVPPTAPNLTERKPYRVRLALGGGSAAPNVSGNPPSPRTMPEMLARDLPIARPARSGSELESEFFQIVRCAGQRDPLAMLEATALLTRLLAQLLKLAMSADPAAENPSPRGEDHRNRQRIARAIAHIEANYSERITLADLASAAGLSTSRFAHLFKAHTGLSPMDFVRRVRIDQARRLLADVELSVKEIAHRVGFDDAYHFSKVFRATDGLPPTQFREALLAAMPK